MVINLALNSIKSALGDLLADVLYWPFWWYSRGLLKAAKFCLGEIKDQQERLGLWVWLKNIFTPMYGQYDWEGRLISFLVRLVQVIFRAILLMVWAVLMFLLFLVWLTTPVFVIYQLYLNLV